MHFLTSLTLLLIFQLLGEVTSRLLKLSIPGPVLGMVFLLVLLLLRKPLVEVVEPASTGLLGNLSLLFIPAGVGVVKHFGLLGQQWLPISIALVVGTLITLAVTALVMQGLMRLFHKDAKHG